jgi:heme/copper-type cytochrome/quinol oxidase subunit 2
MLNLEHPERLMVIAVCMMLFGCIVPFLMVPGIGLIESTFFMNFLSFIASTFGLLLGIVGIAVYRGRQAKNKKDEEQDWHE